MSFFSTRGGDCGTASQAVLRGLAGDGGLFVPSIFPVFTPEKIASLCGKTYQEQAVEVIKAFFEDYSLQEIETSVQAAYSPDAWDDPAVAPVKLLSPETYILELFHGPTLAFKDIALKLLPHLIQLAAKKNNENREVSIIVATSGDTGKAALEGFKDVPGTSCSVFYPNQGVSQVQALQMLTTGGSNTHVLAVNGNFDNAQTGVKALFGSKEFHAELDAMGKVPSSANSINFGRLAPQIVYYFTAYTGLIESGAIRLGQHINFVVPTGNFGDILAGYYAMRMGLPIEKLICASNKNNVLTEFFDSGTYYTHRAFFKTMSPSMDILVSSNLERLLYEATNRDANLVKTWMNQLKECGSFCIGDNRLKEIRKIFWADYADDAMTGDEIRRVYEKNHYVMDPHTAVASHVLNQYRKKTGDQTVSVIVSTASPYKFAPDVLSSIQNDENIRTEDFFACSEKLEALSGVSVPKQVKELRSLPIRHKGVCDPADMGAALQKVFQK